MLEVKWTGEWPCLCHGEWIIKHNGKELNIPDEIKINPMYTYGSYVYVGFDNNYQATEDKYFDGLKKKEWLKVNHKWIHKMFEEAGIEITKELLNELYDKINNQDFREMSCGGCL